MWKNQGDLSPNNYMCVYIYIYIYTYTYIYIYTHIHIVLMQSQFKSVQSCPTLCDPMDSSQPGSTVHGIFQARILEWVEISSSRGSSWPMDWTPVSCLLHEQAGSWALAITWEIYTCVCIYIYIYLFIYLFLYLYLLLVFSPSVVSDSFETPWTETHQAPLSMGCPMQEYWSEWSFPSPGYLLNSGIKPTAWLCIGR